MTNETNGKESLNNGMIVSEKSNVSQNAFWNAVLGMEVDMTITDLGTDAYKILQVDQFTIIAENKEYGYMLISKSSIIAVCAPDVAFPDLATNLVEGVRKIKYKASDARTKFSKQKNNFEKKPYTPRSSYPTESVAHEAKPVPVIVKKKHSYDRG